MNEARGPRAAFRRHAAPRLLVAFAVGAALNLAFAPFGWWPLAVAMPAALFALIRGVPARRAAAMGASFGAGLFGFGTYWLYTCLHVFGLVPLWLTIALQAVLVALLAAYSAALGYLANRFWLRPGGTCDALVLPSLWLLCEWLRGWLFSGFPWLSLGYAFIDSPLAGWAPLFGVYGITWAAAAAAALIAAAAAPAAPATPAPRRWLMLAAVAALFAIPALLSRHSWTAPSGEPFTVAVVQGAVPQNLKWQADHRQATMDRYAALTERAWGARLIVWPESAMPVLDEEILDFLDALRASGRTHGADFAIGLIHRDPDSGRYFNGLVALTADGAAWYYKRHLVPFGEYFPVPAFVRSWMRLMSLPYDDFTPGDANQPPLHAAGQTLGVTICYEDAFGSSQLAGLRDATLLVNVTNNAWFGDSTAPHEHLQISRTRALESGRDLIRATNDGVSAVIGANGRVMGQLPQFQQGVLRVDVQPRSGLTPYARFGNYPVVLGSLALLAWASWRRRHGEA